MPKSSLPTSMPTPGQLPDVDEAPFHPTIGSEFMAGMAPIPKQGSGDHGEKASAAAAAKCGNSLTGKRKPGRG